MKEKDGKKYQVEWKKKKERKIFYIPMQKKWRNKREQVTTGGKLIERNTVSYLISYLNYRVVKGNTLPLQNSKENQQTVEGKL